jgi:hypothetical protein
MAAAAVEQLEENGLTSIFVPESEGSSVRLGRRRHRAFPGGFHGLQHLFRKRFSPGCCEPRRGRCASGRSPSPARIVRLERGPAAGDPRRAAGVLWGGMVEPSCRSARCGRVPPRSDPSSAIEPISNRHSIAREPVADLRFRDAEVLAVATATEDPFARRPDASP